MTKDRYNKIREHIINTIGLDKNVPYYKIGDGLPISYLLNENIGPVIAAMKADRELIEEPAGYRLGLKLSLEIAKKSRT